MHACTILLRILLFLTWLKISIPTYSSFSTSLITMRWSCQDKVNLAWWFNQAGVWRSNQISHFLSFHTDICRIFIFCSRSVFADLLPWWIYLEGDQIESCHFYPTSFKKKKRRLDQSLVSFWARSDEFFVALSLSPFSFFHSKNTTLSTGLHHHFVVCLSWDIEAVNFKSKTHLISFPSFFPH